MGFADYDNSILSLANSVKRHYGLPTVYKTLPEFDLLLKKDYRTVIVLLFDGLGMDAIETHLPPDAFLRRHLVKEISSVFPPTTTAATTTVLTGLPPAVHGWLGWSLYFEELSKNVDLFPNTDEEGKPAAPFSAANRFMPVRGIHKLISEGGHAEGYVLFPWGKNGYSGSNNYRKMIHKLVRLSKKRGKKYIYCYNNEPDATMHQNGCASAATKERILAINAASEKLYGKLKNTLLTVTADHGLIDVGGSYGIEDFPELNDCLVRKPSMEPRALNCFVKPGCDEKFLAACEKAFGASAAVFSKREAIGNELFGHTEDTSVLEKRLGDYIVTFMDGTAVYNTEREKTTFIGIHAGAHPEEMRVPFIAAEKR